MSWQSKVKQTPKAKVTGPQVNLLLARAKDKGFNERAFLEWLEYDSGLQIQVARPEQIEAWVVDPILLRLSHL